MNMRLNSFAKTSWSTRGWNVLSSHISSERGWIIFVFLFKWCSSEEAELSKTIHPLSSDVNQKRMNFFRCLSERGWFIFFQVMFIRRGWISFQVMFIKKRLNSPAKTSCSTRGWYVMLSHISSESGWMFFFFFKWCSSADYEFLSKWCLSERGWVLLHCNIHQKDDELLY